FRSLAWSMAFGRGTPGRCRLPFRPTGCDVPVGLSAKQRLPLPTSPDGLPARFDDDTGGRQQLLDHAQPAPADSGLTAPHAHAIMAALEQVIRGCHDEIHACQL